MRKIIIAALCAGLGGCQTDGADHVSHVADRVVYQTVYKPVREPCPATEPQAPGKLPRPLPADPGALVDMLLAKLAEYNGPGKYVARVHDFAAVCTRPVTP